MKNLTKKSALAIGVLASSALCGVALSAPNTFAVEKVAGYFHDDGFLECVVAQYNALNPTTPTTKEDMDIAQAASIQTLNCNYGNLGQGYTDLPSYFPEGKPRITDTAGITKLTGLRTLYLTGHAFNSISLHDNQELRALSMGTNNNLTGTLDLSYAKKLQTVNVGGNNLTGLKLDGLTDLAWLQASYNNLSTLDLSTNTNLQSLELVGNSLTALNTTKNTKLGTLFADPSVVITPYTQYGINDNCEVTASIKFVGVYNTIVKTSTYSFDNESHILTMSKRPAGNGVDAVEVISKYEERSATYRIVLGGLEDEFAKLDKCEVKKQDDAEGSGIKVPDTGGSLTEETNAHIIEASIIGIVTVATLGLVGAYIHNRRQNHVKF